MATRDLTEGTIGERAERAGVRLTGRRFETKWAPLTTEFWAMVILIVAVLIAAAISDSLEDRRAWTLATIIGAAYILSRGFAKSGTGHTPLTLRRPRRRT